LEPEAKEEEKAEKKDDKKDDAKDEKKDEKKEAKKVEEKKKAEPIPDSEEEKAEKKAAMGFISPEEKKKMNPFDGLIHKDLDNNPEDAVHLPGGDKVDGVNFHNGYNQ